MQDMLETVEGEDARVIRCLQDYREELLDTECKTQVHKLTQRASQDIRMDEPLADACYEDRSRLCVGVQPVRPPKQGTAVAQHVWGPCCHLERLCTCWCGGQLQPGWLAHLWGVQAVLRRGCGLEEAALVSLKTP